VTAVQTKPEESFSNLSEAELWEAISRLPDEDLPRAKALIERAFPPSTDLTRYRDRPADFIRETLGEQPWEKQCQIAQALADSRRVTVRSCNGSGKTWLASRLALWFLYSRPGSIVVTTAPTWRQVRDQIWRYISGCHARAKLPGLCNQAELQPDSANREWYAMGISTDDPTRFQGTHASAGVLLIVDEASGVAEPIFEAGAGFMTGAESYTLLIGNPNSPTGTFYRSHQGGNWARFHIAAHDVPPHILAPEYIERARADWGEDNPAYQVRVLGEFPAEGDDTLIGLRYVTAAQEASLEAEGEVIVGADIARFGSDESVAIARQGPKVIAMECWRGQDTQASAGKIAAFAKRWNTMRVAVDEIGVGAGVVDALKAAGCPNVVGVNVGAAARDKERFANLRAEIFWALRDRCREGAIALPKDDLLYSQLCGLKYKYTPAGKVQIESKDDARKRGETSPDRADALALAFAPETRKKWAFS